MGRRGALGIALIGVAVAVSGCITGKAGTEYATMSQGLSPPRPGQSRIILLSAKGTAIESGHCNLTLDGAKISTLTPGTYIYLDRPAGSHVLVASQVLFPGETKQEFRTESGKTYYFLAKSSEKNRAMSGGAMVFGLAGAAAMAVATSNNPNQGPVDLIPMDEATARPALAELLQAD